jgi:hypothetical protein
LDTALFSHTVARVHAKQKRKYLRIVKSKTAQLYVLVLIERVGVGAGQNERSQLAGKVPNRSPEPLDYSVGALGGHQQHDAVAARDVNAGGKKVFVEEHRPLLPTEPPDLA